MDSVKILKKFFLIFIFAVFFSAVFVIFAFGFGIYAYWVDGDLTFKISKIIPYPAIIVDWESISYHDWLKELESLKKYSDLVYKEQNVFFTESRDSNIKEALFQKLVEEKIILIEARKNNIFLEKSEVEEEWGRVTPQEPGKEFDAEFFLSEFYGLNKEDFNKRVLEPYLLRKKFSDFLSETMGLSDDVLLEKVNKARSFILEEGFDSNKIDSEYSAKNLAGEILTYFPRGVLEENIDKEVFGMRVGEISKPLKSSIGYHIIKLEDLLYDKNENPVQASISQFIIRSFDFKEWLENKKKDALVFRLVK